MTTWIETHSIHQDGTPVTRRIKLESYDPDVWFTDNAYAEVSDDVADILATTVGHIEKLSSEPVDPGDYYGDAGRNEVVQIPVPDGIFDTVVAQSLDVDDWSADTIESSEGSFNSLRTGDADIGDGGFVSWNDTEGSLQIGVEEEET